MATLKNTTFNDTGFFTLPAGTTAQRPVSPVQGMSRYNTTLGYIEWYDTTGATWRPIYQAPSISVEYLVVAGGGGGGTDAGGGAGAGGLLTGTQTGITSGTLYTVTVGAGGAGGTGGSNPTDPTNRAINGSNSVFGSVTAIGGGYGGMGQYQTRGGGTGAGGSGGGGGGSYPSSGQGGPAG